MCLLIVVSKVVADSPLIVAANRDERYDRAASPLAVLSSTGPQILGGRDMVAGGTWLAVNEHGVVAGLTNKPVTEGRDPTKRSRGEIPLTLAAHDSAAAAVDALESELSPEDFNPCWVLVGDRDAVYYVDMTRPERAHSELLWPGVHILENKPLGEPSDKVTHTEQLLGDIERCSGDDVLGALRTVLRDHSMPSVPTDDSEASQRQVQLSACCVHTAEYGTRSSMLIRDPLSRNKEPDVWASDGPSCTHSLTKAPFVL